MFFSTRNQILPQNNFLVNIGLDYDILSKKASGVLPSYISPVHAMTDFGKVLERRSFSRFSL